MKPSSLPRLALLTCLLGVASLAAVSAQDATTSTNTPPSGPPPGGHHHHGGLLTKEEWQELKTDHDQVLSSNPSLKTQEDNLHQQMMALQQQIDAAIVAADPNAAPIIAKLKAAHHDKHGHDEDSDSGSN